MQPHSQAAPGLRMGSMSSLLDTPERVGDPVPQLPPPKQSPSVVENPEQGPFLPSIRLGGGKEQGDCYSCLQGSSPVFVAPRITIVEHLKTGPLLRKGVPKYKDVHT